MNGDQIFNSINNIQISIKNHKEQIEKLDQEIGDGDHIFNICLLYTSPSPRDGLLSRMPSSA